MQHPRFFLFILACWSSLILGAQTIPGTTYDLRDGTAITAGQTSDGVISFGGNYGHHGSQYGLNMKEGGTITVQLPGSSTVQFLGSKHSGLRMEGTVSSTGDLGIHDTKVDQDLAETYDFVYTGPAATAVFQLMPGTGNDLYLPEISITPAQPAQGVTVPDRNIVYFADFRDGSILPTNTTGQQDLQAGLLEVIVGPSNAYGYNGSQHGAFFKPGNQLKLQVAGNSRIRIGGSIYSSGSIEASSETGAFDVAAQSATTSGNFGNDGSTVDFLYAGEAGTVTLEFTATTYLPYLEIVPIPFPVTLTPWVQKAGTVTLNNVTIDLQTGTSATENAKVNLSSGTVISAGPESASILMELGEAPLSSYSPVVAGDISEVITSGDSLFLTFSDASSDPAGYLIIVRDASLTAEAEAGKTYTYNFANGSELPQVSYQALRYATFLSKDGLLAIHSNTAEEARQFGYHDSSHGGVFFPGNSFAVTVAGDALITFLVDTYGSAADAVFRFANSDGEVLGSIPAQNLGQEDGFPSTFAYEGPAGQVTATLVSEQFPTAEIYLHGMVIQNAAAVSHTGGKSLVWDFGAEQLDTDTYVNQLDEETINGWYDPSIPAGTAGHVLPDWSAGGLSWVGGGNDRLRTTNTRLTRYDEGLSGGGDFTGRLYVNSAGALGRYLSITLEEDDEITLYALTQSGGGKIHFAYAADPEKQNDVVSVGGELTELNFAAKQAGIYHIFDSQDKPSYYRLIRRNATYVSLTGTVDLSQAPDIPGDFTLQFTNAGGKTFSTGVTAGQYNIELPAGYGYDLSLGGANGYIISNGNKLEVSGSTTSHDVSIIKTELYTVSGEIIGLDNLPEGFSLDFYSEGAIYEPEATVNAAEKTYTVSLEPNRTYSLSANGINDYYLDPQTLSIPTGNATQDLNLLPKPVYAVDIQTTGLTEGQLADLSLEFTNRNEPGYTYRFENPATVSLRDGTYEISAQGLDSYPLELALTSWLTVNGAETTKTLAFEPVTHWSFDDADIAQGDSAYKGLQFTGSVRNEMAKGHLVAGSGATVRVPMRAGELLTVTYYYTADFAIAGGESVTTDTRSTSRKEKATYRYPADTSGYVTLSFGESTGTYITDIRTTRFVAYTPTLTVGPDKDYQTINAALAAARLMDRGEEERVTILIDPGNYEEMLVIDIPAVTLKNAAAAPTIGLRNQGVDIDPAAVRVTSYFGHGYDYYSMGTDQKWNAGVLAVNRENDHQPYGNKGGTSNGSYWNATVVVYANGFRAEDIIFENSFNQYISRKESEDTVVEWTTGGKGERPTDYGNTSVQDRSFVERAAAIGIADGADRVILDNCRVVGRQDSFFGGRGARVVVFQGAVMGAVDYLFGGMTAVFYQTDLVMNVSDASSDRSYLTAAQQREGRGYLMYECTVTSAVPGLETASAYRAKPGYFGRPWEATTSEVVFYNTTVETSDYPGYVGRSLIEPQGWTSSLGGESEMMYEYGTVELSGESHLDERVEWSTVLTSPVLLDGTEITTFNFTRGNDGWDPLPALIEENTTSAKAALPVSAVEVYAAGDRIYVNNVSSATTISVYSLAGTLVQRVAMNADGNFAVPTGFWIVVADADDGRKAVKVYTRR